MESTGLVGLLLISRGNSQRVSTWNRNNHLHVVAILLIILLTAIISILYAQCTCTSSTLLLQYYFVRDHNCNVCNYFISPTGLQYRASSVITQVVGDGENTVTGCRRTSTNFRHIDYTSMHYIVLCVKVRGNLPQAPPLCLLTSCLFDYSYY